MRAKALSALKKKIVRSLSDDLLSGEWLARKKLETKCHSTFGHCYIAAEAAYHLLGGKPAGWQSYHLSTEGGSHWFLRHRSGIIFDPTAEQFGTEPIPYQRAVGKGFLTQRPSKRAQILMSRVLAKINAA